MQEQMVAGGGMDSGSENNHGRTANLPGGIAEALRNNPVLPALGQSVMQVVRIASDDDNAVQELARFVLSDVALTQKILTLANSVQYRTLARAQVTSVSRAIYLIGFDAVKALAMATLVVEGLAGASAQLARRELLNSLAASLAAQELVRNKRRSDAESLPVVALFMNLGRLLVAVHEPKAYQQIEVLARNTSENEAALQVLGCSLSSISSAVLRNWQIPQTIVNALAPAPVKSSGGAVNDQDWLRLAGQFCADVSAMLYAGGTPDVAQISRKLAYQYGDALQISNGVLTDLLSAVQRESAFLSRFVQMPADAAAEPAVIHDDMAGLESLVLNGAPEEEPEAQKYHPSGKPINARDLLLEGIEEMSEAMSSGSNTPVDMMRLALAVLARSLGLRYVVLCMKVKSGQYLPVAANGVDSAARKAQFTWPQTGTDDLFHLALSHQVDMAIADASLDNIMQKLPGQYRRMVGDAGSLLLLPLQQGKQVIGLIYGDRAACAPEGISREEVLLIRSLKAQLVAGFPARP